MIPEWHARHASTRCQTATICRHRRCSRISSWPTGAASIRSGCPGTMTPAMGAEPRGFRAEWLHDIAALCALDERELRFLESARSRLGMQLDPAALRKAVA